MEYYIFKHGTYIISLRNIIIATHTLPHKRTIFRRYIHEHAINQPTYVVQ